MKIVLFVLFSLVSFTHTAFASCEWADSAKKAGKTSIAMMQYMYCAQEEGDVDSQYELGTMFYKGTGLQKNDFRRSAYYYTMAANRGYAPAQTKLGLLYWRGEGVEVNLTTAHKWLYLAQEPVELKWFYPYANSVDKNAKQLFAQIDALDRSQFGNKDAISKALMPSYRLVADFQHKALKVLGAKYLSATDQNFLTEFLVNIEPDVPSNVLSLIPNEDRGILKPAVLTVKNFANKKAEVISSLQKKISE
ncbi:MAG: hypothetical protein MJ247_05170 [Alphaproteobacteria bacterium]|nr:hypothetical protein [Alphaproteobacteria bacterium]